MSPADHRGTLAVLSWARETVANEGLDAALLAAPHREFTESQFLREIAWVILCSGFREKIVRRLFWKISICFLDWSSAREIVALSELCVATASEVFRSKPKISAVAKSAGIIDQVGFNVIRDEVNANPVDALKQFPFIGDATAFHLAKNLGFDFPKPDRHLINISNRHGYTDVHEFCAVIAAVANDSVRNIDTLLWRISEMGLGGHIEFPSIARL